MSILNRLLGVGSSGEERCCDVQIEEVDAEDDTDEPADETTDIVNN